MTVPAALPWSPRPAATKILLVAVEGLGGQPLEPGGRTELEAARTPHLDAAARDGTCGLLVPVAPGITPALVPAHLALLGYDPLSYPVGLGVVEALGVGFPLAPADVAVRGNFCTLDAAGLVRDRRAGRPTTEQAAAWCQRLQTLRLPDAQLFVLPVHGHRFAVVLRGPGLGARVTDGDPLDEGLAPPAPRGLDLASEATAEVLRLFLGEAPHRLGPDGPANDVLLRGAGQLPMLPPFAERTGCRGAALAVPILHRGLARLVGLEAVACGPALEDQVAALERVWADFDFFWLPYPHLDAAGRAGHFAARVALIERLDGLIPRLRALGPDVLVIAGSHSTPARLAARTWHPAPVLLVAESCRPDGVTAFGERACLAGGLGQIPAHHLLPLALAHAGRLRPWGA